MKRIILLLLFLLSSFVPAAQNYDLSEIRQLVTFLNQPSTEEGKTNAEAIGIAVQPTEANVTQWEKNLSIYTKNVDGIEYVRDISLENKGNFRLGGNFSIENFNHLQSLFLYGMGNVVKVKNCPALKEFRLRGKYGEGEHVTKRGLEITGCPKLWQLRIDCLVTEFRLDGSDALEQVDISYTNLPVIDFSVQTKLEWLHLNNNAFSEIIVPKAGEWRFECKGNRIEPADLMGLIRKVRGDDLYLDWRFPSTEYTPQQIICNPVPVGTKIDLRAKATFKYGNPEKTYTGTFKWQYKNGTRMVDISANADMKQGVYTIPADMANRTITATYQCEPFFTEDKIQYIINIAPGKETTDPDPVTYTLNVVPNNPAWGKVTGSGRYKAGEKVPLVAKVVHKRASFENWKENAVTLSNNQDYFYTMPARNAEIKGYFSYMEAPEETPVEMPTPESEQIPQQIGTFSDSTIRIHMPGPEPDFPRDTARQTPKLKEPIKSKPTDSIAIISDTIPESYPYLILTSNLQSAELSGSGRYTIDSLANISAKAPAQYKFEGWFLAGELLSPDESFRYRFKENHTICMNAVYTNIPDSVQQQHPMFDGKYSCTFRLINNDIPRDFFKHYNMEATGILEYRPKTKDVWSPYTGKCLGILTFCFGDQQIENTRVSNSQIFGSVTVTDYGTYMALTIFEVTDKEIIAGAGGYMFGSDIFILDKKLMNIHHIPYTLNKDGSITLPDFNLTGGKDQSLYDVTFYPTRDIPVKGNDLWFPSSAETLKEKPEDYERWIEFMIELMRESIFPEIEEQLKK